MKFSHYIGIILCLFSAYQFFYVILDQDKQSIVKEEFTTILKEAHISKRKIKNQSKSKVDFDQSFVFTKLSQVSWDQPRKMWVLLSNLQKKDANIVSEQFMKVLETGSFYQRQKIVWLAQRLNHIEMVPFWIKLVQRQMAMIDGDVTQKSKSHRMGILRSVALSEQITAVDSLKRHFNQSDLVQKLFDKIIESPDYDIAVRIRAYSTGRQNSDFNLAQKLSFDDPLRRRILSMKR